MVNFQAVGQEPDACSLITVCAGDDDDFVPAVLQALRYIIHVHLHSAEVWNEKI